MLILKASEIKKGDVVYQFGAWNFLSFGVERGEHFHRDPVTKKGIYIPRTVDQAYIRKHIVHSCGKKRMYLMAEDGVSRGEEFRSFISDNNIVIFGNFATSQEIATQNLKELFANDTASKVPYEILITE